MNGIKRSSSESFMRRFILAARARKDIIDSYEGVIGRRAIERLMEAGRSMVDYGMFFHPRPTEAEKTEFLKAAQMSMNNKKEGREGIDLQTYMFLTEQLYAGGNLKTLRFYLGYAEKRIARESERRKMAMIQAQGKENKELEMIKQQGSMNEIKAKGATDANTEAIKGKNAVIKEVVKKNEGAADQAARRLGLIHDENPIVGGPNSSIQPSPPQSNTNIPQ
jgi:hypothetical protein